MEKAYDTLYDELLTQLKPLVLQLPKTEGEFGLDTLMVSDIVYE
jgi:hypothetical protein